MPDGPEKRKFTAELRQIRRGGPRPVPAASVLSDDLSEARHREVMAAIRDICARLAPLTQGAQATMAGPLASVPETGTHDHGATCPSSGSGMEGIDQDKLLRELADLKQSIERTKQEIAALRCKGTPPATPIENATNELDAVVQSTEKATEGILLAAETIDGILNNLRNQASSDDVGVLEEAADQIVRIFEACNFQDITGQRITKVVNTMKFIEDRVERMIEILGGMEAFNTIEMPAGPAEDKDDDAKLMQGPPLENAVKISQDDIDKLFP